MIKSQWKIFFWFHTGVQLHGEPFYVVAKKSFCEACYLASLETCCVCSELITDRVSCRCRQPLSLLCDDRFALLDFAGDWPGLSSILLQMWRLQQGIGWSAVHCWRFEEHLLHWRLSPVKTLCFSSFLSHYGLIVFVGHFSLLAATFIVSYKIWF